MSQARRSLIQNSALPYIPKDYIRSDGTQYIDIEVPTYSGLKIEVVCMFHNSGTNHIGVFGRRFAIGTNSFSLIVVNGTTLRSDFGSLSQNITNPIMDKIYTLTRDGNKMYIDGILLHTHQYTEFSSPDTIYLFGVNTNNVPSLTAGKLSILKTKIWLPNGELVRDCVAGTDLTGEACLYDFVTQRFFKRKTGNPFITN